MAEHEPHVRPLKREPDDELADEAEAWARELARIRSVLADVERAGAEFVQALRRAGVEIRRRAERW